jgi:YfiH family protein
MVRRLIHKTPFYTSEKILSVSGIFCGFSTRSGVKRLFDMEDAVTAEQVHGSRVAVIKEDSTGKCIKACDGLITDLKDTVLGIRTADCAAVILFDAGTETAGVLHCGWRGTCAGIVKNGVNIMKNSLKCNPENMVALIGPHIGMCCFEVGHEVIEQFDQARMLETYLFKQADKKKYFLNLGGIVKKELLSLGIPDANIDMYEGCTFCEENEFYSYRRSRGRCGRMWGFARLGRTGHN